MSKLLTQICASFKYSDSKALLPNFKAVDQTPAELHILRIGKFGCVSKILFCKCGHNYEYKALGSIVTYNITNTCNNSHILMMHAHTPYKQHTRICTHTRAYTHTHTHTTHTYHIHTYMLHLKFSGNKILSKPN